MRSNVVASLLSASVLLLSGCALTSTATPSAQAGLAIQGTMQGGQQPINGAHVYLMAANTTGYGAASVSLLNAASTGHSDAVGAYVLTNARGGFSIANDYTCTPGTQVYIYGAGGDAGGGVNSAVGLMTALGACPSSQNFVGTVPFLQINEVTTVAAAYAMAGFATDVLHVSSSGTALAQTGIANAFLNAANLVAIGSGTALTATPAGNGVVPQTELNTLGNLLAACINSNGPGSAGCGVLLPQTASGGVTPADTASAAINMAHNPGANIDALYGLQTAAAPFQPALTAEPNDFTVAIAYSGGGLAGPYGLAIDSQGNVWAANGALYKSSLTKLSSVGAPISPAAGYTAPGINNPTGIAIDLSDDAWFLSDGSYPNAILELSPSGTVLSPAAGYSNSSLSSVALAYDPSGNLWAPNTTSVSEMAGNGTFLNPTGGYPASSQYQAFGIAVDPSGSVWVPNQGNGGAANVTKFSNSGVVLSGAGGFTGGGLDYPGAVAIDGAGGVWVTNSSTSGGHISKFSNAGAPLSGSGFTGGGLHDPYDIAIDGAGNAWVVNMLGNSLSEFSTTGTPITPSTGYLNAATNQPFRIAVDGAGSVWTSSRASSTTAVVQFIGLATPVVTPLAAAVKGNTLGSRP